MQELENRLKGRIEAFFSTYADPQYDVWKGGRSKAKLLTEEKKKLTK
jgi:hypothetical protein